MEMKKWEQMEELKRLIKRCKSDNIKSSAHDSKIKSFEERLKKLENTEIIETEVKPIQNPSKLPKKKTKTIICPNPFKDNYFNNCEISYETYAPNDSVKSYNKKTKKFKDTLCPTCATKQINSLNNFLPTSRPNIKSGSRLKCIKPAFGLEENEIYFCTKFGFATVVVREKRQSPLLAKSYSKDRFLVYYKPFKQPGKFVPIKT